VNKQKNLFLLKEKRRLKRVPKKKKKLSQDIIDHWPEIFKDIEIKAVPIEYIKSINIHFTDGKIWEIDIDRRHTRSEEGSRALEDSLEDLFEEYEDVIDGVDFKLDTEKVKLDIQSRTKSFLKKRR
jgi:hypothetical protein